MKCKHATEDMGRIVCVLKSDPGKRNVINTAVAGLGSMTDNPWCPLALAPTPTPQIWHLCPYFSAHPI